MITEDNYLIETAFSCYEVLRTVTKHLPVSDLKSLRLVNRHWRECGSLSLKEKSQIVLDKRERFEEYFNFLQESSSEDEYFIASSFRILVKAEHFESSLKVSQLFLQLWDFCSRNVKEVHLSLPWTCAAPILRAIFSSGTGAQLEKLSLSVEDVSGDNWGEIEEVIVEEEQAANFTISSFISLNLNISIVLSSEKKVFPFEWNEFVLEKCPNICHLAIQSDYGSGQFYRIVNALVERGTVLRTLKIGTRDQRLFSEEFLRKLALLTSPETEIVSLGFLPSVKHDTPLDIILSKAASSLKQLSFLQYRTSNQATILSFTGNVPGTFPNLTSLRVTKELVPNLNFLSKLPKLGRLEIYRDSTIGQRDDLSNPIIRTREIPEMSLLRTLILEMFCPVEHVWKLVRWFPNLTRLQMKVNDVVARVIFMKWVELKELYLIGEIARDNNDLVRTSLTDEGITGIQKECLQEFPDGPTQGGDLGRLRTMPYIGNLTKLETCKLQVVPDYLTGLTDYSIFYGLMDLPKLQVLTLVKTLVSPTAVDELRRKSVSVTLSTA